MEKFKNLERVACKELEKLDSDYANKNEFTEADAKRFDMSYARGRNMRNGRYMSREVGDAMSGHYPPEWMYPRSYDGRPGYYY